MKYYTVIVLDGNSVYCRQSGISEDEVLHVIDQWSDEHPTKVIRVFGHAHVDIQECDGCQYIEDIRSLREHGSQLLCAQCVRDV